MQKESSGAKARANITVGARATTFFDSCRGAECQNYGWFSPSDPQSGSLAASYSFDESAKSRFSFCEARGKSTAAVSKLAEALGGSTCTGEAIIQL